MYFLLFLICSWFWGPSVSLQDCLAAFFSADELKEDNMYSCEKCKKLRNGIKYSKVIDLPEVSFTEYKHNVCFKNLNLTLEIPGPVDWFCLFKISLHDFIFILQFHIFKNNKIT